MPVIHNKENLQKLLIDNNINPNDARARGEFYRTHFNWKELSQEYTSGKSIRDISKITGLSYDVIRANLKRELGQLRNFSVKGRSNYKFYYDLFFPRITPIGAYFLGWMYSDGCITKDKITITLQHSDASHVKYLANLVSDKSTRVAKNGEEFNFYDVELIRKFEQYNLYPNKSHINFTIPIEKFDKETIPYLLLGLFEGDGTISKNDLSCGLLLPSNSWEVIKNVLSKDLDLNFIRVREINSYGLILVNFKGKSYFSLLDYIYSSTREVKPLQRKLDLYKAQLQRSMNGKTSPYKKLAVKLWDSLTL